MNATARRIACQAEAEDLYLSVTPLPRFSSYRADCLAHEAGRMTAWLVAQGYQVAVPTIDGRMATTIFAEVSR